MTVTNVLGYGVQKVRKHQYRGVEYNVDLLPEKLRLKWLYVQYRLKMLLNTAISVLRTGEIGDGKIFISPVSRVIKVRTGEDREGFIIESFIK